MSRNHKKYCVYTYIGNGIAPGNHYKTGCGYKIKGLYGERYCKWCGKLIETSY